MRPMYILYIFQDKVLNRVRKKRQGDKKKKRFKI